VFVDYQNYLKSSSSQEVNLHSQKKHNVSFSFWTELWHNTNWMSILQREFRLVNRHTSTFTSMRN